MGIQDLFCNSGHIDRSGAEEYGSEDGRKRDKKWCIIRERLEQ